MTKTRRTALGLIALAAVLSACQPPAPYEGIGPRVAIVGDSLTHFSMPDAKVANEHHAVPKAISWNAVSGVRTQHWNSQIRYVGLSDKPDVVVMATGTNDAYNGVTTDDVKAIQDALRWMVNNECVLWVNTRSEISGDHGRWNYVQSVLMAGASNRRILDWDTYSNDHPEWFGSDNIHFTTEGNAAYAQWLIHEIDQGCSA